MLWPLGSTAGIYLQHYMTSRQLDNASAKAHDALLHGGGHQAALAGVEIATGQAAAAADALGLDRVQQPVIDAKILVKPQGVVEAGHLEVGDPQNAGRGRSGRHPSGRRPTGTSAAPGAGPAVSGTGPLVFIQACNTGSRGTGWSQSTGSTMRMSRSSPVVIMKLSSSLPASRLSWRSLGSDSGGGTSGMSPWYSSPREGYLERHGTTRIGLPLCRATTRRELKLQAVPRPLDLEHNRLARVAGAQEISVLGMKDPLRAYRGHRRADALRQHLPAIHPEGRRGAYCRR